MTFKKAQNDIETEIFGRGEFMVQYLSEEEQYKKYINNEEIRRIKDLKLQKIRSKYWEIRHKAYLDIHGISDSELGAFIDKIDREEEEELAKYRESLQNKN